MRAGAVLLNLIFPADGRVELAVVGREGSPDMLSENVSWREPWNDVPAGVAVLGRFCARYWFFFFVGTMVRPAAVIRFKRDSSDGSAYCLVGEVVGRTFLGA